MSIERRIAGSLALINDHVASISTLAPTNSRLLDHAYQGVSTFALGGKHLRARLVHISAGDVTGAQLQAATVFGACVDMMHGAFLIHDDIIDRDDTRRGHPTVHAAVRDEYRDEHLGTSIGITTGDLGLNSAIGSSSTRISTTPSYAAPCGSSTPPPSRRSWARSSTSRTPSPTPTRSSCA